MPQLTAVKIKPGAKSGKYCDGAGINLNVAVSGSIRDRR